MPSFKEGADGSFIVKIPPNASPGDPLSFETPDGRTLDLAVPEGIEAGSVLRLTEDPATGSWSCVAELPPDSSIPGAGAGTAPLSFDVVVPDDAIEGTMLHHTMEDGRVMDFAVPAGVQPGSILRLTQDPESKSWGCEVIPADADLAGHHRGNGGSSSSTAAAAPGAAASAASAAGAGAGAGASVAAPEPVTLSMVVPPDAAPGSTLTFEISDGRALDIAVPEGVFPGWKLTLTQDPDTKGWSCSAEAPAESETPVATSTSKEQKVAPKKEEPLSTTVVVPMDALPGASLPCATPDGKQVDLVLPPGVPGGSVLRLTQDPATRDWGCVVERMGPPSPANSPANSPSASPAAASPPSASPAATSTARGFGGAGDASEKEELERNRSETLETPRQRRSPEATPPSKSPSQHSNGNKDNRDDDDGGSPGGVSDSSSLMRRGPKPMPPPVSMLEGAPAAAGGSANSAGNNNTNSNSNDNNAGVCFSPFPSSSPSSHPHSSPSRPPFPDASYPSSSPSSSPAAAAAAAAAATAASPDATAPTTTAAPAAAAAVTEEPPVAEEEAPVCQQKSIFDLPGGSPSAGGRRPPQKQTGWPEDRGQTVLGTATEHREASFNPDEEGEVFQGGSLVAPVAESGLPPLMGYGSYGGGEDVLMQVGGQYQTPFDDGRPGSDAAGGSPIPQLMAGPDDWGTADAIEGDADSREIVQPFSSKQASPGLSDGKGASAGEPEKAAPPPPAASGPTSWFQSTLREVGNYVSEQLQLPPSSLFGGGGGGSSTAVSPSKSQKGAPRDPTPADGEKQPVGTFAKPRVKREFCSDADEISGDIPPDPTPQLPWQAKPWLRSREKARDLSFANDGEDPAHRGAGREKGAARQSSAGGAALDPSQVTVWYCKSHNTSSKRPKADGGKVWKCRGCHVEVNTNYKEFAYCQPCSQREMRCMVCGEDANNSSQMLVKPREEHQPQQLQASTVPPRYCEAHSSSERRTKGGGAKYWDCLTCGRQVTTNYQQFSLCPPCSDRDKRCMICGEPAPEAGRYVPPSSMGPRRSNNSQSRWRSDEVPAEKAPQAVPTTFAQKPSSMLPTETLPADPVEEAGMGIDVDLEESSEANAPGLKQAQENRWVPQLGPSPFTLPSFEDSLNAASAGGRMMMPAGLPCGGSIGHAGNSGCGFGGCGCSGGAALPVWAPHGQHPSHPSHPAATLPGPQPVLSNAGGGAAPSHPTPQSWAPPRPAPGTSSAPPPTAPWAPAPVPTARGYPASPSAFAQQQQHLPQFQPQPQQQQQQQQQQQHLPQFQQHHQQHQHQQQQQQQQPSFSPVHNGEAIPVASRARPMAYPTAVAAPVVTGRQPYPPNFAQMPTAWGHQRY